METEKTYRLSKLTLSLLNQIQLYNAQCFKDRGREEKPLPPFEMEYKFCSWRNWRFDFAWKGFNIAVEVEGITRDANHSRHTRALGYTEDCLKYSVAACLHWKVIRLTKPLIESGLGLRLILTAFEIESTDLLQAITSLPPKEKKNGRSRRTVAPGVTGAVSKLARRKISS